jgi:hypothetical protein
MIRSEGSWEEAVARAIEAETPKNLDPRLKEAYARVVRGKYEWIRERAEQRYGKV